MNPKSVQDGDSNERLMREVNELASKAKSNNRLGESYVIESNAKVIASNAQNEVALLNLTKKLQIFNEQADDQTRKLINLTWVIVILTVLMLIGLIIQIVKS